MTVAPHLSQRIKSGATPPLTTQDPDDYWELGKDSITALREQLETIDAALKEADYVLEISQPIAPGALRIRWREQHKSPLPVPNVVEWNRSKEGHWYIKHVEIENIRRKMKVRKAFQEHTEITEDVLDMVADLMVARRKYLKIMQTFRVTIANVLKHDKPNMDEMIEYLVAYNIQLNDKRIDREIEKRKRQVATEKEQRILNATNPIWEEIEKNGNNLP